MELFNLSAPEEVVNFKTALVKGLGRNRGLYMPAKVPELDDVESLLSLGFVERSQKILGAWLADELGQERVDQLVSKAFGFELPLIKVDEQRHCLELFHGPTLAFKDFGARFMAQCLSALNPDQKITILTATSGDTGAAVADAFYGLDNVEVVILYPDGRISELQRRLFTTLGGNIHTLAVDGDFDQCQDLVKQAFEDSQLRQAVNLNSANSINISRLLAQVCYYFEVLAQVEPSQRDSVVVSVPSGNFGNLTAGLLAKAMGLPVAKFIAATNANDTVPRFWNQGEWQVNPTQSTESNAMDVSDPSNWPRAEFLLREHLSQELVEAVAVSEDETQASLQQLHQQGYVSEPHAAVAAHALANKLQPNQLGVFLGTAHPAKFQSSVERSLNIQLELPAALAAVADKTCLAQSLAPDYQALRQWMLAQLKG
ncbi:threonine synthase [Paraferrimonas sedimenticola]|uniref:Threonine synthase n=1 Tax=Paraferrimonas sedimenticola TaxID=375674 RepID=A0AA37RXB2_9GAMM|nr:threonine synthase [Paraferrimonas sedimenticola]GLP97161.1 threonine synthase [Paraferrimonas sedimenticola]